MTREEYLRSLIKNTGQNIKEFAHNLGIPYTTLLSMLKNIGGSSVDSVIKICKALNITVEQLSEYDLNPKIEGNLNIPEDDMPIIKKFLNLTERNKIKIEGQIDAYLKEQGQYDTVEVMSQIVDDDAAYIKNNAQIKTMV